MTAMRMVNGHENAKVGGDNKRVSQRVEGFQTNGARRQQQQQQQPVLQVKGDDETNDAKIAEFAKTISEKDKKIKATAAEHKTKVSIDSLITDSIY